MTIKPTAVERDRRRARAMIKGSAQVRDLSTLSAEQILKYLHEEPAPDWDQLIHHDEFNERMVILFFKRSRFIPRETIQHLYQMKVLRKHYRINLAMMRCRFTPPHISMKLVESIRWMDLLQTLRQPVLAGPLRVRIEEKLKEQYQRLTLGEQIAMARHAPRPMIRHLRAKQEPRVVQALLNNYFFTYEDAMFIAGYPETGAAPLEMLVESKKWTAFPELRKSLLRHHNIPRSRILPMAKSLKVGQLRDVLRDIRLPLFTKHIIHRVLEEELYTP